MRKFEKMDGTKLNLINEIELKGIKENEDGLFELCEVNDNDSFETVETVYEDSTYYVNYNEVSRWADSNIVIGYMEV